MALPGETTDPVDILNLQISCAFNTIDADRDGKITPEELDAHLKTIQCKSLDGSADDLAKTLWYMQRTALVPSEERKGAVDLKQFSAFMHNRGFFMEEPGPVAHAFSEFDHNNDGKVTPQDVLDTLHRLGDDAGVQDVVDAWKEVTENEDFEWNRDKDSVALDAEEFRRFIFGALPEQVAEEIMRENETPEEKEAREKAAAAGRVGAA
jgi:Ca2+-binding EF-hand superfamily protein